MFTCKAPCPCPRNEVFCYSMIWSMARNYKEIASIHAFLRDVTRDATTTTDDVWGSLTTPRKSALRDEGAQVKPCPVLKPQTMCLYTLVIYIAQVVCSRWLITFRAWSGQPLDWRTRLTMYGRRRMWPDWMRFWKWQSYQWQGFLSEAADSQERGWNPWWNMRFGPRGLLNHKWYSARTVT